MKLLNFTIIKLTLCLILGILLNHWLHITLEASLFLTIGLLILTFIALLFFKRHFHKTVWFGSLAFLVMISAGMLTSNFHKQSHFKNHYTTQTPSLDVTTSNFTFRVRKVLKPNNFYYKYVVDLIKVENKSVKGQLLFNIQKDSLSPSIKVDDILYVNGNLEEINAPLNPGQFNYKSHLENQYIYHQLYARNNSILKVSSNKHTIFGYADALRQKINIKLKYFNLKDDELSIINALLLGQRQDISETTYNNYANAGAIHILAVSGLHVGIILLILNFILKPLETFGYGKIIKILMLVGLLWGFAVIAGLSASVTRAVTMFSVFAISLNLKRPTNTYNILAISMFVLLLIKPMFLFDVGFQLSYIAVLAIVWIQPYLYHIWKPKWRIVDFFWQIFTVTLAAQLGIIPLSLFYFHQFPGLFFVSNLAIIPILGFILGLGILVIVLALLNALPLFLAEFYGNIISYMNHFIAWVANQEQFLFKDISFGFLHLMVFYLFIISVISFVKNKKPIRLKYVLVSVILIQSVFIYNKQQNRTHTFNIFHKSRFTLLAEKQNEHLTTYHDLDSLGKVKNNIIKNYRVANYINTETEKELQNIYFLNDELLYLVDSLDVYQNLPFKPKYVLLKDSPRVNLKRLIDSIGPKLIIADGSNYKSYVKRWRETCKKEKLPFHYTGEKGALIIDLTK